MDSKDNRLAILETTYERLTPSGLTSSSWFKRFITFTWYEFVIAAIVQIVYWSFILGMAFLIEGIS